MTVARAALRPRQADTIESLALRAAALAGWRRYGLAALLGVLATLALPPIYATPLLVPAFALLLWLQDGIITGRAAFALGWWFGFGFFLTGLYWVGISMTVDIVRFGWMIPFATGGLSAGLAIFPGLAVLLLFHSRATGAGRAFALAAAWTALEWVRGHVLTGFPWNLVGYTWTVADAPIQFASVAGIYGLSLLTVAIAALPAAGYGPKRSGRPWPPVIAALSLAVALWVGGAARLAGALSSMVPGVTLRLVQPNIAQEIKWQPERIRDNLLELVALSAGPGYEHVSDLVWPETAVPFDLASEPQLKEGLARIVPKGGLLLTGADRKAVAEPAVADGSHSVHFYNSFAALDETGRIVGSYDKFHLVPFGEYVPMRNVLPIDKVTPGRVDFSAGPGPRTLALPHLPPVSPLICYEAIFPDEVSESRDRPRWLLNITNDAWFGNSSGPYQHFESARLRAVEEGVPLVRVANTGISGVVDAYGRVVDRLGLGRKGVIDATLPTALPDGTVLSRHGTAVLATLLGSFVVLTWHLRRRD
jgi:apolipoprotein N-acyltransferase